MMLLNEEDSMILYNIMASREYSQTPARGVESHKVLVLAQNQILPVEGNFQSW